MSAAVIDQADADRFDFFMVTHHRSRLDLSGGQRLTPVALCRKGEADGFVALRRKVEAQVRRLAGLWLARDCRAIDVVKAVSDPFIAGLLGNLWLSEVRLAPAGQGRVAACEEATYWVLASSGGLPERWQGPADGVIPPLLPVTVRSRMVAPSSYQAEVTL